MIEMKKNILNSRILVISLILVLLTAAFVWAGDGSDEGGNAHSESMSAESGEAPIEDPETTKDPGATEEEEQEETAAPAPEEDQAEAAPAEAEEEKEDNGLPFALPFELPENIPWNIVGIAAAAVLLLIMIAAVSGSRKKKKSAYKAKH